MSEGGGIKQAEIAAALGLPPNADEAAILAAIGVMRAPTDLINRVTSLDLPQVREMLDLPASACPLDCAAALAARLPPDHAATAVPAMQLVQARARLRAAQVESIMRDALRG